MRDRALPGLILILIGGFFLLANFGLISGDYFLLFLSAGFLAAYVAFGRNLGLLVPGAVLLAIGSFTVVADLNVIPGDEGPLFLTFLGAAFLLIWVVHTAHSGKNWGARNWPLFPGGILTAFGILVYTAEIWHLEETLASILSYWPLILVVIGILIIVNSRKTTKG